MTHLLIAGPGDIAQRRARRLAGRCRIAALAKGGSLPQRLAGISPRGATRCQARGRAQEARTVNISCSSHESRITHHAFRKYG